jgi:hypothetical protein
VVLKVRGAGSDTTVRKAAVAQLDGTTSGAGIPWVIAIPPLGQVSRAVPRRAMPAITRAPPTSVKGSSGYWLKEPCSASG